jgi:threonine/homoserine/homoserine lactone efflux protein
MMDLSLLPVFLAAVLLLMVTPGPDMVFVTANALGGGRRAGFASLMGVATGANLHILAAAAGLSAVLLASETAYHVIRFAGAAYLFFLGVKFLTSLDTIISVNPTRQKPLGAIYRQGVVTNLLNPKAALFTLSFVPQFVTPEIGLIWSQMLVLGLVIVTVMILVDLPIVLASGRFAEWLGRRSGADAVLGKLIGLLLIGLAIYVAIARKPA